MWLVQLTYFPQFFIPEMALPDSLSTVYYSATHSTCGDGAPAVQRVKTKCEIQSQAAVAASLVGKSRQGVQRFLSAGVAWPVCAARTRVRAQGWANPGTPQEEAGVVIFFRGEGPTGVSFLASRL